MWTTMNREMCSAFKEVALNVGQTSTKGKLLQCCSSTAGCLQLLLMSSVINPLAAELIKH